MWRAVPDVQVVFSDALNKAREKTERLITIRERSVYELRTRLVQAGFSAEIARIETERAQNAGLIDDERFTRLYVSSKLNAGWGRNRIASEMKRFGIDLTHKEGYPEDYFPEGVELEGAIACIERFHTTAKDERGARFRRLMGRGFTVETAKRALAGCPERMRSDVLEQPQNHCSWRPESSERAC